MSRRPGEVPDEDAGIDRSGVDVRWGVDTDGDGHPDTLLTVEGPDLLVYTDLDGDGLADRLLRIGPDGSVRPDDPLPDGMDGAGSAAHSFWSTLLGPDPGTVGGPG